MTVELRPLGVTCNIGCQYCYHNPEREAGNHGRKYDLERMKAAILKEGGPFCLFGGEPLLIPVQDLEHLWSWGLQQFKSNGIQTNGSLITARHIELFARYQVHVGISIDGPGELNDVRWAGSLKRTRELTEKTERAIERLCEKKIFPSLIITLHRANAVGDKLPALHTWVRRMEQLGVTSARLHLLESESDLIRQKYGLSTAENVAALLSFARLGLTTLHLDVFKDLENMLMGRDNATTCVWNACDPYTTSAVQGVEGGGQRSNCGRTNKDGIDFRKGDSPGYERYVALYHTPQEFGGCNGCRFFLMCKGQCPGTAIAGDWRNRTEHCEVWKALFRHVEDQLLERGDIPLSAAPIRPELERRFIERWSSGQTVRAHSMLESLTAGASTSSMTTGHGDAHGDHFDSQENRTATA